MALRFIGIDPSTGKDESPTVWIDEERREVVLQGWTVDEATLVHCRETGGIPDTEAVIRMPARMTSILRKACDAVDDTELR